MGQKRPETPEFGARLREAREAKGFSARGLIDAAGLDIQPLALYRWERGVRQPDLSTLDTLASTLDIDLHAAITGAPASRGADQPPELPRARTADEARLQQDIHEIATSYPRSALEAIKWMVAALKEPSRHDILRERQRLRERAAGDRPIIRMGPPPPPPDGLRFDAPDEDGPGEDAPRGPTGAMGAGE